jgi:hypothetical protein
MSSRDCLLDLAFSLIVIITYSRHRMTSEPHRSSCCAIIPCRFTLHKPSLFYSIRLTSVRIEELLGPARTVVQKTIDNSRPDSLSSEKVSILNFLSVRWFFTLRHLCACFTHSNGLSCWTHLR